MCQIASKNYGIKINSIGTALPSAAVLLAKSLEVSQDIVTKSIYTAPAQLFSELDKSTATKANEVLSKLGFDVEITGEAVSKIEKPVLYDVAVYLTSPLDLPKVTEGISAFIGVSQEKANKMLMSFPPLVLGGVSIATVKALEKRLPEAEVVSVEVRNGTFYVRINQVTSAEKEQLKAFHPQIKQKDAFLQDVSYSDAQKLWKTYSGRCQIVHSQLLRGELVLHHFDLTSETSIQYLQNNIGIPLQHINELQHQLPLSLFDPKLMHECFSDRDKATKAGLACEVQPLWEDISQLRLNSFDETHKQSILNVFHTMFPEILPQKNKFQLKAPILLPPKPHLFNLYVEEVLVQHGCDVLLTPTFEPEVMSVKKETDL